MRDHFSGFTGMRPRNIATVRRMREECPRRQASTDLLPKGYSKGEPLMRRFQQAGGPVAIED
jgi:hypothetical protein